MICECFGKNAVFKQFLKLLERITVVLKWNAKNVRKQVEKVSLFMRCFLRTNKQKRKAGNSQLISIVFKISNNFCLALHTEINLSAKYGSTTPKQIQNLPVKRPEHGTIQCHFANSCHPQPDIKILNNRPESKLKSSIRL